MVSTSGFAESMLVASFGFVERICRANAGYFLWYGRTDFFESGVKMMILFFNFFLSSFFHLFRQIYFKHAQGLKRSKSSEIHMLNFSCFASRKCSVDP